MLSTLNAQVIESRLDAKYGSRRCTETKKTLDVDDATASRVRFCPLPDPVDNVATYIPRRTSLDVRRTVLVDTYLHCPDLQDVRHVRTVPPSLTGIARWGMRDVSRPGPVRVDDDVVALVSSQEVGALLIEVARSTFGLPPTKVTRLVMHMCTNDAVAREWLACFGH